MFASKVVNGTKSETSTKPISHKLMKLPLTAAIKVKETTCTVARSRSGSTVRPMSHKQMDYPSTAASKM